MIHNGFNDTIKKSGVSGCPPQTQKEKIEVQKNKKKKRKKKEKKNPFLISEQLFSVLKLVILST
mgnify:CR=1 FL=1